MNLDLMLDYLMWCILPAFRARGVKDEDGKRGMLFFDGVGCGVPPGLRIRQASEGGGHRVLPPYPKNECGSAGGGYRALPRPSAQVSKC